MGKNPAIRPDTNQSNGKSAIKKVVIEGNNIIFEMIARIEVQDEETVEYYDEQINDIKMEGDKDTS